MLQHKQTVSRLHYLQLRDKPGPDLGVVGGEGVVREDEDEPPARSMDLGDSGRLGLFGFRIGLLR